MNFFEWLDETKAWHWFAKNVLAKWTFRIAPRPKPSTDLQGEFIAALLLNTKSSDRVLTFVCQDKWAFGSMLIRLVSRGTWSHSGFVFRGAGMEMPHRVDMRSDGLHVTNCLTLLSEYDSVALVSVPVAKGSMGQIAKRVASYIGKSNVLRYDWEQELKDESSDPEADDIYCSELVWLVLKGFADLVCSKVLGRRVFSPEDVAKNGTIVWRTP